LIFGEKRRLKRKGKDMDKFERLFGIKASEIKRDCILLPILQKKALEYFQVKSLSKGKLFSAGSNDSFTLVHTGIGPGFTGDAVLYLKDTACRRIFLFGSCGLVAEKEGVSLADLVSPSMCYANESFSELMKYGPKETSVFYPDKETYGGLLESARDAAIKGVCCSTIVSLKLEEDMLESFILKGIEVVDMECSAFFSAAASCGLKASALFYITDIIGKKPFYAALEPALKSKLDGSIKSAADILCEFIKTNLSV